MICYLWSVGISCQEFSTHVYNIITYPPYHGQFLIYNRNLDFEKSNQNMTLFEKLDEICSTHTIKLLPVKYIPPSNTVDITCTNINLVNPQLQSYPPNPLSINRIHQILLNQYPIYTVRIPRYFHPYITAINCQVIIL